MIYANTSKIENSLRIVQVDEDKTPVPQVHVFNIKIFVYIFTKPASSVSYNVFG
jgi:hypothetical protein